MKELSSEKVDCAAAISYNLACDLTKLAQITRSGPKGGSGDEE